ncbi:MAG: adenylate/guanylate cyclase domain-containing protein, partial [Rhizobiaceae bacterium]|nr:adenylate/guanylate cyclase domain-containing protein [Rhizobiaceae bacterium]
MSAQEHQAIAEQREPRWVQPIRVHLSVLIVLLLVAISVPLMGLTYEQGKKAAITGAEQQMRLLGRHAIDRYRSLFYDGFATVKIAAALEQLNSAPPAGFEANKAFLVAALQGSPFIDGIYVGYPDGSFIHAVNMADNPRWKKRLEAPDAAVFALRTIERDQQEGAVSTWRFLDSEGLEFGSSTTSDVNYDPRRRPWYKAAFRAGQPVAVGPYVTAMTQSLSLTLSMPMQQNPRVIAGIDVLLETISEILAKEAVSPNGRGFIFDREKKLIVHSDKAMMDKILAGYDPSKAEGTANALTEDPTVEAVRQLLRVPEPQPDRMVRFTIGDEPYLAQISTVMFSDLVKGNTIVITAPLSDFTGPNVELLRRTLLVAAAVVLAGILAALMIARIISRALYALAGEAREIGNLEVEPRARTMSWIAEINTLGHALDSAREAIRTFALYVPRELVRRIVSAGQSGADNGLRQEVSILFTDIRDFTTISEQHSPEQVVDLLSSYFELCNRTVEHHNGVIIQYLGDSIYAMWNAPSPDRDHAADACRCALALKGAIDDYNRANRLAGRPELVTRFGVHSGEAVVGSVGATARRQYTAMGDTV